VKRPARPIIRKVSSTDPERSTEKSDNDQGVVKLPSLVGNEDEEEKTTEEKSTEETEKPAVRKRPVIKRPSTLSKKTDTEESGSEERADKRATTRVAPTDVPTDAPAEDSPLKSKNRPRPVMKRPAALSKKIEEKPETENTKKNTENT